MRLLLAALLLCSLVASAQTLYRYVDKQGRTVLSDQPPKGVAFEKVEYDRNTNVIESQRRSQATRPVAESEAKDDRSRKRAQLRDELRAAVDAARERLAAAKLALEQGRDPKEDEWQPTVTRPDNGGKPNSKGVITGRGGKLVCSKDGHGRVVCPAVPVPSEAYRTRIESLERAVQDAEEALKEAELKYRRGAPD
ncbi:MAG: DUF4124 domain-containing protein [Betaproteobacteria bacterium]|nr:DUF4124 domain-containing protein [Betaproteobacteria bacterium]